MPRNSKKAAPEANLPAETGSDFHPLVASDEAHEILETLQSNLGDTPVSLQHFVKIRVPSQGSTIWQFDTADGKQQVDSITGIILFTAINRSYYVTPYEESGGGVPPDCSSYDGLTGIGKPGGKCSECPLNKFKSAIGKTGKPGRGKACQEFRLIFMTPPDEILPYIIKVPSMSLQLSAKYLLGLTSKNLRTYHVMTTLTLAEGRNQDGLLFSRVNFTKGDVFPEQQKEKITAYVSAIRPQMEKAMVELHTSGSAFAAEGEYTEDGEIIDN